jgi:hypothetical protein
MLFITAVDATSGDRLSIECATTTDRIAIDRLVVELRNLGDIAAQLCRSPNAPVLGPESVY